jgi:hypothetical protein
LKHLLALISFGLYLVGCQSGTETVIVPATPVCATTTAEIAECSADMTVTSPVTVTGTANFYKRTIKVGSYLTLAAPITTPLPIKFAEVRVLDASNTVVQCGTTDSTGALKNVAGTGSLQIPGTAGNYTVQVLARANHTIAPGGGKAAFKFYASVKKDICNNVVQSISGTSTVSAGTASSPTLTAFARESESSNVIQGGAFNIFNDLFTTYDYLGNNTGLSDITCMNPKLNVYWQAGFNPAQYIYTSQDPSTLSPLSFYLRGQNELYISGGQIGNVATADTDHFDDAVIIHELGHHIEDVCGKMDSPGGSHNGLFRIDPRLAWSEGWGNFMGAHIIKNNLALINPEIVTPLGAAGWTYYLDTNGYSESASQSSSNQLIKLDLTRAGNASVAAEHPATGYFYDRVNWSTAAPGEGHFREVSIARSLFKSTNSCASLCTNTNYYPKIWQAFEKDPAGIGMGKSIYSFRNSALFYNRMTASFGGTLPASIDATLSNDEAQQPVTAGAYSTDGPAYAIKLVPSGTACPIVIQPKRQLSVVSDANPAMTQLAPGDAADKTAADERVDQRYSNHFYRVDLALLPSVTDIKLNILSKDAGTTLDFDLLLFNEGFTYVNETCTSRSGNGTCSSYAKATSSQFLRSDRSIIADPSVPFTKTIQTLNLLSTTGNYLLDVRAYNAGIPTLATTQYTYQLTDQSGGYLCPNSTY